MNMAVSTTFPNDSWEIYAKNMLLSFVKYWPKEVPLLVELDDNSLAHDVTKILNREGDCVAVGWTQDHKDFVARNKGRDDRENYRQQAVRFCHKVFAIHRACQSIIEAKKNGEAAPRYLIWMDADVITTKLVTLEDIKLCLPKEGDAVSYLGRKDWDHSECGWLAFDLENGGDQIVNEVYAVYKGDAVFSLPQWHDSYVWDCAMLRPAAQKLPVTNLTEGKPGMDIWPHSPMGKWSTHYKGPAAKSNLMGSKPLATSDMRQSNIIIQTKNAIPDEEIRNNIATNQLMITKWIRQCTPVDEWLVVVSAGPMLIAEDVRSEVAAGRRIVAVKHALEPLKKAGIKPWACILLDPREHVANFVENADRDILWIVASQVNPNVVRKLLDGGCTVWGYHASVGAGEHDLTKKQQHATISGGSATATRGLYTLNHLGFSKMRLYGYDLCLPDEPDMKAIDERGQPKYLKLSVGVNHPLYSLKRGFWSEPQLIAQFEELNEMIKVGKFQLKAFGNGIVPFMIRGKETGELREMELKTKINGKHMPNYQQLLKCTNSKKTLLSMLPRPRLPQILRRPRAASSF
jgi:hypothetical protein